MWAAPDGEPGWALDTEPAAWVVLPRGGLTAATAALSDGLRARPRRPRRARWRCARCGPPAISWPRSRSGLAAWLAPGESGSDATVSAASVDGEVSVRLPRPRYHARRRRRRRWPRWRSVSARRSGRTATAATARRSSRRWAAGSCARGFTLALAESCTGGLVGHRLTNIPGSSAFFERGMVVYSNRAKEELLGVPADVLRIHGAVSRPCAEAMVRGACERSGAACGLAITGIAGPDGGTPTKPVGTVFIGVAVAGTVEARQFRFSGGRSSVKWQSSQMALDMLRRRLGRSRTAPIAAVRAFVAILLPDDVRRGLAAAVEELRAVANDVVWVGPDNFHVTVKFLGAVDADRLGHR